MNVKSAHDRHASLRWHLREQTAEAHHRLDGMVDHLDLAKRAPLGVFLQGNALAYAALLPMDDVFDGHIARRHALILADLDHLELPAPKERAETAAAQGAAALGYRYVVAGSALGGRVLARHHAQAEDARVLAAGGFLADDALGAYWKDVLSDLDGSGSAEDEVVNGAIACFGIFERSFRAALETAPN